MSEALRSTKGINVLNYDNIDAKRLSYITKKYIDGDNVVFDMGIENRTLIKWAGEHRDHVQLLNEALPENGLKISTVSKRVRERLRYQVWRAVKKSKDCNRAGSKKKREEFLGIKVTLSILFSDVCCRLRGRIGETSSCLP